MSIQVNDFKYIPGKNDAEYIKLLKEALERQKQITNKAIAKIKELSNCSQFPNGWIPCSERLPKKKNEVIGYVLIVVDNVNADGRMICMDLVLMSIVNGDGTLWISHSIQK